VRYPFGCPDNTVLAVVVASAPPDADADDDVEPYGEADQAADEALAERSWSTRNRRPRRPTS
jgi:hypothetical protein